ncbi:MAG TPA: thioredoxin domain-containing protein [Thermoanaerobaculia bacterium]
MKRLFIAAIALTAVAAVADDPPAPPLGERAEKVIKEALPVCSEPVKASRTGLQHKLPVNLTGAVIRLESEQRPACAGQWVALTSREGSIFLGVPWFLDKLTGTPEAKLKAFAWANLQQHFDAVVDKTPTRDGFYPVTMYQLTERGKMPLQGEIDPTASVVFIGHFHPINADYLESRLKYFQPFLNDSPVTGAAKPTVTVVEFSDFECPSCQHTAGYMKPILQKYPDRVRYIRYDLPLVTMHPWAFAAAVAGRAIWRQKPEAFWQYKEQVYANQEKLMALTFDDFARGFAQDHDLDMKKYDADVNSAELQQSILAGAGTAFSNDVRATPTYMVNGRMIDPGPDGKALETYIAGLLK